MQNDTTISDKVGAVCSTPRYLAGQSLANVNRDDLNCDLGHAAPTCDAPNTSTAIPESSENVGVIIGTVFGSICVVVVIIAALAIYINYRRLPERELHSSNSEQNNDNNRL